MSPADDLTRLVREGEITKADAKAIREHRRRKAQANARREAILAEREREQELVRERRAEEKRMADRWAYFVLAHIPGLAESVIEGRYPLRLAFQDAKQQTGCELGCEHKPYTLEERERLILQLAEIGMRETGRES